jgi:four helix bundle suffix protein
MTCPAQPNDSRRLVRTHTNYRELKSFQVSEVIYDATVKFCDRFIDPRSRLRDQMVQAARSGRQNIAEGTVAGAVSRKSELKLVGVARASLEELLLDYEDFLRQRGLKLWPKDHPTIQAVRRLAYARNKSYSLYANYVEGASPEVAANTVQCLIHQANYLLERHLKELEQAFLTEGGFTEGLYRARREARQRQYSSPPSHPDSPSHRPS